MDGTLGLKGWQWVFIIEAIPAVLLDVRRTRADDRSAGAGEVAQARGPPSGSTASFEAEREQVESAGRLTMLQALTDARVLVLSADLFHRGHGELWGWCSSCPRSSKGWVCRT